MKKGLTNREKGLLLILFLMGLVAVYNYAFYIPTQEKIATYTQEAQNSDATILLAEGKIAKLDMMQKELAEIKSGDAKDIKELPKYDNSRNVMNSLSSILANATYYNISFGGVSESEGIVRRDITLTFSTRSYEVAKNMLSSIYNGPYRCLMKDLHISQGADVWNVNVQVTYFEYK